jgi:DNA adenine methylase
MVKTPLRYPGGKSKAIKKLLPFVPNYSEFREPFVGGASVFLSLKQLYPQKKYWINDLNNDLYHFWLNLRDNSARLINGVESIKNKHTDGRGLHKMYIDKNGADSLEKAIRFFVLNRITFSGTIEAGGYSQSAFQSRFTPSCIERLKENAALLTDTKITDLDYENVVKAPGEDVFIFLDPPYLSATKSRLYGKKGNLHTSFDHARFAEVMKNTKHKWLITYDDCEEIRKLFSFANIVSWEFQYGMNNYKQEKSAKGKELIITNYKVNLI